MDVAWYLITFSLPPHWPAFVHPYDLGTLAYGVAFLSVAWSPNSVYHWDCGGLPPIGWRSVYSPTTAESQAATNSRDSWNR